MVNRLSDGDDDDDDGDDGDDGDDDGDDDDDDMMAVQQGDGDHLTTMP